jgi:hypothetical protein
VLLSSFFFAENYPLGLMLSAVQRNLTRRMSTALLDSFKLTAGQTITCKAAVAWEPKKPLDVTDIQV